MNGRGMKKWAPYASLIEQKGTISRMKQTRTNINKPLLSQEQAMQINGNLLKIRQKSAKIVYFLNGTIQTVIGQVTKVNFDEKYLAIQGQQIPFNTLLSLQVTSPTQHDTELDNP